ncbi:hypothetical protein [Thermoplasma volcanium GSS1]|uniref:ACT domain-containing protein n=1 Tax=Thermoplasma volcanium (strain ATCC 51530 / DSM 4299 / JCM 9571 / NBRC 15438 / GSS1) TaxID=273116 RepID=Q978Y0_THEVO|nr:ACT domain-containing protein [Thermoplasma volcanium]BAB60426.1 hypothetical protein [Thermoplasma volcanium GSS1]
MNVSDLVKEYVSRHPYVMEALSEGIVNFSSLSRKIMEQYNIKSFQAVEAALKRYKPQSGEPDYKNILSRSTVEMYTNVTVIILKPKSENMKLILSLAERQSINYGRFRLIQGVQGAALVMNDNDAEKIVRSIPKGEVIQMDRKLSEIVMTSPETITFTRGYVAYLSSILSHNGINIIQIVSFYTDVTFILDPEDLVRSFNILMREIRLSQSLIK